MTSIIDRERRKRLKETFSTPSFTTGTKSVPGPEIGEVQKLKAKYPVYRNIPDGTLLQALATKHPQYRDLAEREFGTITAPPSIVDIAKEGFKRGQFVVDRGNIGEAIKSGRLKPEEGMAQIKDAEDKLRQTEYKGQAYTLPAAMIKSTSELLPFLLKGMEEALKQGTGGAVAGAGAAVASGFVPTAPATAATGFTVGATYGIIETARRIEGGNNYLDMLDRDVDPAIARPVSEGVGLINGVIEVSQIGMIARRLPGASILFKKKVSEAIAKSPLLQRKLLAVAKDFGTTVTAETAEEVAQEATSITGEALGSLIDSIKNDKEYGGPRAQEALRRMKGVLTSSAQGFPLLLLPGSTFQTISAISSANKASAPRALEVTLEEVQAVERGEVPKRVKDEILKMEAITGKKVSLATLRSTSNIIDEPKTRKEKMEKFIDEEGLKNFGGMKKFKERVAPKSKAVYRPALRLSNGKIIWTQGARIHADVASEELAKNPKFEFDDVVGSGGLTSSGDYFETRGGKAGIGDIEEAFEKKPTPSSKVEVVKDSSGAVKTGRPVVFHGTPYKIEGGLTIKRSGSSETDDSDNVIYFTDNKKIAEQYRDSVPQSENESITERMNERLSDEANRLGFQEAKTDKQFQAIDKQARANVSKEGSIVEAKIDFKNPLVVDNKSDFWDYAKNNAWIKRAREGGYDGLIIKNATEAGGMLSSETLNTPKNKRVTGTTYVVFKDSQIRALKVSSKVEVGEEASQEFKGKEFTTIEQTLLEEKKRKERVRSPKVEDKSIGKTLEEADAEVAEMKKAQRKQTIKEIAERREASGTFPSVNKIAEQKGHNLEFPDQVIQEKRKQEARPDATLDVQVQTLNEVKIIPMTTKQYVDFKESLKENKTEGIKIVGVTPRGSSEAGYVVIFEQAKGLTQLRNKLGKILDVEYPFHLIDSPKTGFAIKTYLSRVMAGQEKALRVVSDLLQFDLSLKDYSRLAFAAESLESLDPVDRDRMRPAIEYVRGVFDDYFKILHERVPERFQLPWPQSRIERNKTEMESIGRLLLEKDPSIDKRGLKFRAKELQEENDYFENSDIKFVHIPLRMWFEEKFRDKENFKSIIGRKSPSLKTFIEFGYLEEKDVDIRDILANYIRYVEQQLAMKDIIDAAQSEKLIKSFGAKGTEEWVTIPDSMTPMLKGKKVHPVFAQEFEDYFGSFTGGNAIGRVLGAVKMMQFYNPLILPMYDLIQGVMAGALNANLPSNITKAIRQDKNKTSEYWDAYHNGLFSTPFANPFDSFIEQLNFEKRIAHSNANFIQKALTRAQDYAGNPTLAIRDVYNASWNVAWNLDRFVRLVTYNSLLERGMTPKEAAQLGARFHGDYASVPPKTRKTLNKIIFTPTFEIAMNKLYFDMIRGAVDSGAAFLQGKDMGKVESQLGKGVLYLGAIVHGKHAFMTLGLGFKADEYSRRYFAEVETDFGPREVVMTFANPANIWLRYYHSFKPTELPTSMWDRIARFGKNKAHPLWRIPASILANKNEGGDPIYNPFDPLPKQLFDQGRFISTRTIRLLEVIPGMRADTLERQATAKKLSEASNELTSSFLRIVSFTYMRKSRAQRRDGIINHFMREYSKAVSIDIEKLGIENLDQEIYRNIKRTEEMQSRMDAFLRKEFGE
jgi:hypothetical protein